LFGADVQAMQVQNHVWAPAIMTVMTAVLNVPINMVLVHYYDFWGAALATSVARTLLLVLLCVKLHDSIEAAPNYSRAR
jgi:Na+-driven multidrug efflux pump